MKSLKDFIEDAQKRKVAIGHFNISDIAGLNAIFSVAKKLQVPVIIGVSEGEREFLGVKTVAALIVSLRKEFQYPIFLNADHTHTLDGVKEAVAAGFDAIIFDGSKLSFEENIAKTKEAVKYVKSKNKRILVEGELGYIGSSSQLLDAIPQGAATGEAEFTKPEEALRFVKETGVDLFAPAVGNIHGMLKNAPEPALDIARIQKISSTVKIPLVLHGGSGSKNEEFTQAIQAGISIVHINTEIRKAWREGIESALQDMPNEVAPYHLLAPSVLNMQKIVEEKLRVFSGL